MLQTKDLRFPFSNRTQHECCFLSCLEPLSLLVWVANLIRWSCFKISKDFVFPPSHPGWGKVLVRCCIQRCAGHSQCRALVCKTRGTLSAPTCTLRALASFENSPDSRLCRENEWERFWLHFTVDYFYTNIFRNEFPEIYLLLDLIPYSQIWLLRMTGSISISSRARVDVL